MTLTNARAAVGSLSAFKAIEYQLERLPLPEDYVAALKTDLAQRLFLGVEGVAPNTGGELYVAFFGAAEADFMKVGVSENARNRLRDVEQGAPASLLWGFVATVPNMQAARAAEAAILRHTANIRTRGEWARVDVADARTAGLMVADLAVVGTCGAGCSVSFVGL
jgi:hypothetical protein